VRGNIGFASLPRGNGELVDQFKRASFSIVLNIAEGAGKLLLTRIGAMLSKLCLQPV
jgi:hypothetical protein